MTDAVIAAHLPGPRLFGLSRERLMVAALGAGVLALLLLFGNEDRAAYQTWMDSTAYGHCFFVVPIALFLAWERRHVIAATPLRPMPLLAILALPASLVWLGAERVGIMEGQQLVAMTLLQLLFLAGLGWPLYRAMAVPLLYLFFLVPFGAFVTGSLQGFTAAFIRVGLGVLGIPHYVDGNIIDIPEGKFFVAEACAGLRFLIASIAFGVLYACMIYRSAGRRIAFIAVSIVIPIIANGFRGLGIVTLGHILGSAEAGAVDHVLYGWLFFSLVILLLIAAGLPFREDDTAPPVPAPAPDSVDAPRRMILASMLVVACTAIAPSWAGWIEGQPAAPVSLGAIIGCLPDATPIATHGGIQSWRYTCPTAAAGIDHLVLRVDVLPPHANAGALVRIRRDVSGEVAAESSDVRTMEDRPDMLWQLMITSDPDRMVAIAGWAGGAPVRGGFQERLTFARASITAGATPPVLLTIASPQVEGHLTPGQQNQIGRAMQGLILRNRGFMHDLAAISAATPG